MRKRDILKKKTSLRQCVKSKDGAAILIAIVVMMVAIVLSLSLLLVSYSLLATVNKQKNVEQCKDMAQSVSREIEREITGSEVNFQSFEEMKKAAEEGNNPLWFYLRFHLRQTNWPYYNKEEQGHSAATAVRNFKLDFDGDHDEGSILENVSVEMYWESEDGAEKGGGTSVIVKVTCARGKQKGIITSVYDLSVEENVTGYMDENTLIIDSPYNAENNAVGKNEKWTFSLSERN